MLLPKVIGAIRRALSPALRFNDAQRRANMRTRLSIVPRMALFHVNAARKNVEGQLEQKNWPFA